MTTSQVGQPRFSGVDARTILPVEDEIGGIAIYMSGKLSYYVLDGEWFEAISAEPEVPGDADPLICNLE